MQLIKFRDIVLKEGSKLYRTMPWRETRDPFHILLSEVMLQQTQVERVVGYYEKFIDKYPLVKDLAMAPLSEVIHMWSGLGYNRRAKWLHESAQKIMNDFDGKLPGNIENLTSLPGIGRNTAAAICVYGFGKTENYIETNIRTVYIYHLFTDDREAVHDDKILELQDKILLSGVDPRKWYLSLMDYGTYLKKEHGNISQRSKSYRKQSKFKGSVREVRGALLKLFLQHALLNKDAISKGLKHYDVAHRYDALAQLIDEGFIVKDGNDRYCLKK